MDNTESLAIKHGYYFIVDRDDNLKIMNIEIGKAYRNDDVEQFSIKSENGFLNFYINGKKEMLRDQDLSNSFEHVADEFLRKITDANTKNCLVKRVDNKLVSYYEEVE